MSIEKIYRRRVDAAPLMISPRRNGGGVGQCHGTYRFANEVADTFNFRRGHQGKSYVLLNVQDALDRQPRMVAEIPAPTVVEKSSSPATREAIAVGGDISTRSTSTPSRVKKPLSLPKNSGIEVRLFVGM